MLQFSIKRLLASVACFSVSCAVLVGARSAQGGGLADLPSGLLWVFLACAGMGASLGILFGRFGIGALGAIAAVALILG